MEIYKINTKTVWLKAAVAGGFWAGFEIVAGSFLHNVRFPMSGTLLTFFAMIIMITFDRYWQTKGMIVRAGLITALMKSISPSAVLLGPMTAIFFEALLVELSLSIFGRNKLGYIIGGITALYSVMIHKVLTLLILYGGDIITISKNFYYFLIKQIGIEGLSFGKALLILSLFYVILGIVAAVNGMIIAEKALKISKIKKTGIDLSALKPDYSTFKGKKNYSSFLLFLHLFVIISLFLIINRLSFVLALFVSLVYIVFCAMKYENLFKFLRKPGFWLQMVILLLVSALFYSGTQNLTLFDKNGFLAGGKMILRMFVIIIGFGAVSYELRNPVVKAILYRRGLGNLYQAIGLSFSVLPVVFEKMPKAKSLLRNPLNFMAENISIADKVYEKFLENVEKRKVIIIKGKKGDGKSTYLQEIVEKLKDKVEICGFIAIGTLKNGKRYGFELLDIKSGQKMLLGSIEKIGSIKTGRFYFSEKAFEFGNEIIQKAVEKNCDFVAIDEVGPLELKDKGWSASIEKLFGQPKPFQIWVVRESLVKEVLRKFTVTEAYVFDIEKDSVESLIQMLSKIHLQF